MPRHAPANRFGAIAATAASGSSDHGGQPRAVSVAVGVGLAEGLWLAETVALGEELGLADGVVALGVDEHAASKSTASAAGSKRVLMRKR